MTEFSRDSIVLIAIAFVLPVIIAARRNHAHSQAIALVNFGFTFLVLFSSHLGLPLIPPIVALPVWIGILVWASAGAKSETTRESKSINEPTGDGAVFRFFRRLFAPRIIIASEQDAIDFDTLLAAKNKQPWERTSAEKAALHRFTLIQMKHSGDAKAKKLAEDMEESEKTIADFMTRAIQEAKKDGRI